MTDWHSYRDHIEEEQAALARYARLAAILLDHVRRIDKAGERPCGKLMKEAGRISRRLRETLERT